MVAIVVRGMEQSSKLRADVAQWIEGLNPGGQAEATTIVPAKTLLDGIPRPDLAMVSRFFSFIRIS